MTKNLKRAIPIAALLLIFTFVNFFVVRGHYTEHFYPEDDNATSVYIETDRDDIVEIEDISFSKDHKWCNICLKAIGTGIVTLTVHYNNNVPDSTTELMVHPSGIIYENGFLGSVGNLNILRYEIAFLFLIAVVNLSISLKKSLRSNMYSYKVMYVAGALVFSAVNLLFWIINIVNPTNFWPDRLFTLFGEIFAVFTRLPILFFPIVLPFSILLSVSNIVLLKKEGFRIRNMLGIGLGIVLVAMTVFPFFLYPIMSSFMDVSGQLGFHAEFFFELLFFSSLSYFECMLIGTILGTIRAQRFVPKYEQDYMIILGSGLRADGTLTPLLKNRADRAILFSEKQKEKTGKDLIFVPSGGQGPDEVISEASAIRNYLLTQGISGDSILTEEKSKSTYENMKFSKEIIKAHRKDAISNVRIAFSTTDYHVFRSGRFARKLGMNAYGIGARTKWYFYINAQIREFVANMKVQQKRHIGNLIFIILLILFLLAVSFRFEIL